jgi:DNA replication initiation complex subunit (GINS family)
MADLDYKKLRDIAREEKANPGLVRLQDDFYPSVQGFLNSKFSEMESNRSVMQMREFENATAIIREISLIRQQKILFKAIRSGGEHKGTDVMTREEHGLYDRFCAVIEEENTRLNSILTRFESKRAENAPLKQAGEETRESSMLKKVRFTKDVLAFRGANNETFGPYKNGEEGALPSSEADWLLKGKLAESVA